MADTPRENAQLRLVARPVGIPEPSCWSMSTEPVSQLDEGQVLVEVAYLSVDPGLRGWISEGGSYVEAVPMGAVMRAFGVGRVIASSSHRVSVGSVVTGPLGTQEYAVLDETAVTVETWTESLPRLLGALGISGITAYLALLDVARPRPGATVVVSGAAGSVGSLAGQIARLQGCRVIGIAGGARKCDWLTDELGFDAAIDYTTRHVGEMLDDLAPDGVDVFFDNVGGIILDTVLTRLSIGAAVVVSGTMSQWGSPDWPGLQNHRFLLTRRARMEGFLVFDHAPRYEAAKAAIAEWLDSGTLIAREEIVRGGIAAFPEALRGLFTGDNIGKRVVEVAGDRRGTTSRSANSRRQE